MTNPNGRFGIHGGQYIPETLMNAVIELEEAYNNYKNDPEFNRELTELLNDNIIDIAQLHGDEDEAYIRRLRQLTGKPIIKAFQVKSEKEIADAGQCSADYILLDSGAGTGTVFDWNILKKIDRPYFLAGGLFAGNVGKAVRELHPFAVDVSSGIETDRRKDKEKMAAFVAAVRKEETL